MAKSNLPSGEKQIEKVEDYNRLFEGNGADPNFSSKKVAALDRAWKNRDFEIDKYWSRATYFWAFIAAAFAGYLAAKDKDVSGDFSQLPLVLVCLGFIFSLSWLLVNIGSKKWQENWEKHIDLLEDGVTGPLYKTVLKKHSYSVSNVNITVSAFVIAVWIGLGIYEAFPQAILHSQSDSKPDLIKIICLTLTAACTFVLLFVNITGKTNRFVFKSRELIYNGVPVVPSQT